MIIKKFYIVLFIATCLWGCESKKEEIKADQTSVFVGKYSGIQAHGDAQYPRLTQDSWDVEISRLNEDEVSLDIQTQLQKRVDVLSPFLNTGNSNIQTYKLGKVTQTKSIEFKEMHEITYLDDKRMADVSITGRLRKTGVLVLEVEYDYLDSKDVSIFTIILNKE